MWCTTFAFQPWHSAVEFKRYLARFSHMVEGFDRLHGIMRTVYNQYDSLVRPLHKWLRERGVVGSSERLRHRSRLRRRTTAGAPWKRIALTRGGVPGEIAVQPGDYVSGHARLDDRGSDLGTMDSAPRLCGKRQGGAWPLWETLAAGRPEFGRPGVFADHIDQSKWVSFTTTLHDPAFLRLVQERTGNVPGEGGLITFPDSGWLASIVIPHQPHFIGQPWDVGVFWGYGLSVDQPRRFRQKADVRVLWPRDHGGDARPPAHRSRGGRGAGEPASASRA